MRMAEQTEDAAREETTDNVRVVFLGGPLHATEESVSKASIEAFCWRGVDPSGWIPKSKAYRCVGGYTYGFFRKEGDAYVFIGATALYVQKDDRWTRVDSAAGGRYHPEPLPTTHSKQFYSLDRGHAYYR